MSKLIFLGTAAYQTETQETVSFVIENGKRILFETGPSVIPQLKRAGRDITEIDAIFISHSHCDHSLGFPYYIFMDSIERNMKGKGARVMPLITLPEIGNFLQEMVNFFYPSMEFSTKIELFEASEKTFKSFTIDDCKIITAPVIHSVPTIGVRVEMPDCTIAYSSDTIYCENVIKLAENCDLLIHEAFSTSIMKELAANVKHGIAEEAGKVAHEANAKKLALVHKWPIEVIKDKMIIDEAKKFFDGEVFVPQELEELDVIP